MIDHERRSGGPEGPPHGRFLLKAAAIGLLVLLFCVIPGRADSRPGGDDGGLSVRLEDFDASPGTAKMKLWIESRSSQSESVTLIDPTFNGKPASFLSGWNAEALTLEAGISRSIDIAICADCDDARPEAVSLRFAANGCISSPMQVLCESGGIRVVPASFDLSASETLISPEPSALNAVRLPGRTLTDQLSADEMARLKYAQAVICFREAANGEERFVRFCTVPARVEDDGAAHADFSGYAVTLSEAPDFPLSTVEAARDGGRVIRALGIVLSGDSAFYADLAFELRVASDGGLSMGEYTLTSEELGGIYHRAPYALFSRFSCAHDVLRMEDREGSARFRVEDDRFITVPLNRPLAVQPRPAEALGELYAFFEYFFTDGRSAVHAPFPLPL